MARILLIDDDESVRTMLRTMLEYHRHTVMEAHDGREGLQLLPKARPDLVITDLVMPEQEGIEVITTLRKTHPALKIIAISGGGRTNSSDDYLVMARRLGADLTLAKPFAHAALLAAIAELLPAGAVPVPRA